MPPSLAQLKRVARPARQQDVHRLYEALHMAPLGHGPAPKALPAAILRPMPSATAGVRGAAGGTCELGSIGPGQVHPGTAPIPHGHSAPPANTLHEEMARLGVTPAEDPRLHRYHAELRRCAVGLGGGLERATQCFQELQDAGIPPTPTTYLLLIQACIHARQVDTAFKLFTHMKQPPAEGVSGLVPTRDIFEVLLRGCVHVSKDAHRAWATFDHMRQRYAEPDTRIYAIMMACCALEGKAERAFDLFHEMQEAGLPVTPQVYTSLMEVCASRPDYYQGAFEILENMAGLGFEPSWETYRVLLEACAKHGDVERIAMVWNRMTEAHAAGLAEAEAEGAPSTLRPAIPAPNNLMVGYLFRALSNRVNLEKQRLYYKKGEPLGKLATYKNPLLPGSPAALAATEESGSAPTSTPEGSAEVETPQPPAPDRFSARVAVGHQKRLAAHMRQHLVFHQRPDPAVITSGPARPALSGQASGPSTPEGTEGQEVMEMPPLPSVLSPTSIASATSPAAPVAGRALDPVPSGLVSHAGGLLTFAPALPPITVHTLSAMANGLWNHVVSSTGLPLTPSPYLAQAYLQILCSLATVSKDPGTYSSIQAYLDTYPSLGLTRQHGSTYKSLLYLFSKIPALMAEHGERVFAEMLEWDAELEGKLAQREGLTKAEREGIRVQEQRGRELMHGVFVNMVRGCTRMGEYERALGVIEQCANFRYPTYLPPIHLSDVPRLAGVAKAASQNGDWRLLNRLIHLCPRKPRGVVEEVQEMLQAKHVPKNWWGWEPMGYGKEEVHKLMQRNVAKMRQQRATIAPTLAQNRGRSAK